MLFENFSISRRRAISGGIAMGAGLFSTPGLFAELLLTPSMTEGPFYPDKLPLDTDNDLLIINDAITPAVGAITHLTGKVTNVRGEPLRNAFVEIWQVDNNAVYLHSGDTNNRANQDKNFQGYGRFLTNHKGEYYFRTIKPVPYPGRTPHIHVAISQNGKRVLTSQLFVKGHEQNAKDGVIRRIGDKKALETVMCEFKPLEGSKIGELTVNFDIILGATASEGDDGKLRGGIGKRQWANRS